MRTVGGAGAASLTALAVVSCDDSLSINDDPQTVSLDFSNDFGVLNYAYALEQLEAAFYAEVVDNFYGDLNSLEGRYFQDLFAHESVHRDFLAAAIPALGGELISDLEVDFSMIDFSNRSEVLSTARLLEDTGVSAYNGAGIYLEDPELLALAGKIVSVEARHAAWIRSVIDPGSAAFAGDDVVDVDTGFDVATPPPDVVAAVAATGLVVTPLEVINLG